MAESTENQQTNQQNQQLTNYQKLRPDFNSSQKLTSVPLDGRNYLAWSKAATISLKGKGLLGFINGNRPRPANPGDAQEDWDILDGQTFTLILNSLNPELTDIFVHYETAQEIWDAIKEQHSKQSNNSHVFQIKKDISHISQGSKTVSELIGQVKSKYQELKIYRPITTDLMVLQERDELDQIYTFLDALDSSYESIRAQILNSTEKLTFTGVTARIQQEESRRGAMNTSDSNPKSEGHAFTAATAQAVGGKKGTGQRCIHCNRDGHLKDGCWVLHPHLKPKWKGQGGGRNKGEQSRRAYLVESLDSRQGETKVNGAAEGDNSAQAQLNRLESNLNRITSLLDQQGLMGRSGFVTSTSSLFSQSQIQIGKGPESVENKGEMSQGQKQGEKRPEIKSNKCLAVGFAPKQIPNNRTKWILDSGATDHMTGNQSILRNYRTTENNQFFTVANNEKIKIKGWGMISIFPKGFLQDVFFC